MSRICHRTAQGRGGGRTHGGSHGRETWRGGPLGEPGLSLLGVRRLPWAPCPGGPHRAQLQGPGHGRVRAESPTAHYSSHDKLTVKDRPTLLCEQTRNQKFQDTLVAFSLCWHLSNRAIVCGPSVALGTISPDAANNGSRRGEGTLWKEKEGPEIPEPGLPSARLCLARWDGGREGAVSSGGEARGQWGSTVSPGPHRPFRNSILL